MNILNRVILFIVLCFVAFAVPARNQGGTVSTQSKNNRGESSFTYSGIVLDSTTNLALPSAVVTLLDSQSGFIISGTTNEEGFFSINSTKAPFSIKISFLGYRDFVFRLPRRAFKLGQLRLMPEGKLLKEATVTANTTDNKVDRNSYLITDKMRKHASNAQDLLDQIHGVRFDKLTNSIKVGGESSVLLLVDNVKQSEEYVKNLPTNRISRIEVITEPTGRYLSEGYAAIINFILKKDYSGYDVNMRNMSLANSAGNNGGDWLMQDEPSAGVTYTNGKINLFANYAYARKKINAPVWKDQTYTGLFDLKSEGNSNNRYDYLSNYLGGGINYQLSSKHALSCQVDYTFQKVKDETDFIYKLADIKDGTKTATTTTSLNQNKTRNQDYVGTVFYRGEFGKSLKVYSDFTYNYYFNDIQNLYRQGIDYYKQNLYREQKKYTEFNIEGEYTFNSKFTLSGGYVSVWRKYDSKNTDGIHLLDYRESRNQLFGYLQYEADKKLVVKAGASFEYMNIKNGDKNDFWNIQPYFQLNYKISDKVNSNLSYLTNSYYPTLYQLSPMTTAIDSVMMQSGNPNLTSAIRHAASAKLTLWNRLTIRPMIRFTPKRISEIYTYDNANYYSTFANINLTQYVVQVIYDQALGEYFKLSNSLAYYYDKASYKGMGNSYHGWMSDSEMSYFNPKWNFGAQLGCYRSVDKGALLQGYQMINVDYWMVSIHKQFWNNRASLMVSYFPPLEWGVKDKLDKEIKTSFYAEKYTQAFKPYRNMLMVRFSLRFNNGKTNRSNKESSTEGEERQKRAVSF